MGIFSEFSDHYWDAGLPVIPLVPCDKLPVTKGWQQLQSRMPSYEEREGWKCEYPNGNIGLPLGPQSGLIACDIDTDDPVILGILERVLPPSPWTRIGAKGMVWVYKYDGLPTFRVRHRTPEGLKGIIDMQSAGTQIVLPPSIHPKTRAPYWENVNLVEVLDQVVPLPKGIDQILRDALKEAGFDCSTGAGGVGAITDFVSTGNRDNRLVAIAGMTSHDVLKGNLTLREGCARMEAWAEDFTKKVHGDTVDPKKGIAKLVEFLTRDVKGKGKPLPKGWDDGLDDIEKARLGLDFFTSDDERWSFSQIMGEFTSQLEREGVLDNDESFSALVNATMMRVASNREIDGLEEDRLLRHMADVSGKRLTVTSLRAKIRDLRAGPLKGKNHAEIAAAVLRDLEERDGKMRFWAGKLWQWSGDHWQEVDENLLVQYIASEYGHLDLAKRHGDHLGVVKTLKSACYGALVENDVNGINFVNGFLTEDLVLQPHDPAFGMTYVLPYAYDPDAAAKCQKWLEMLAAYWGEDEDYGEKVEALREAMCLTMFGKAPKAQKAFVLYGVAFSGKSRILEIMKALMPPSCSTAIPPTDFGDRFAPAQLAGKLLNVAGELNDHQIIDSAKFKEIIDGSEISGQHKNQQIFTFRSRAAHWFATNHLPKTRDSSEGFTRRFLILKFDRKYSGVRIEDYDQIVVAEEREAIAAWVVQGMLSLKANGGALSDPPSSQRERTMLENQLNSVRSFLADLREQGRLLVGVHQATSESVTTFDILWTAYRSYCVANGVSLVSSKSFAQRMDNLQGVFGYRQERVKTNLGFLTTAYRFLTLVDGKRA